MHKLDAVLYGIFTKPDFCEILPAGCRVTLPIGGGTNWKLTAGISESGRLRGFIGLLSCLRLAFLCPLLRNALLSAIIDPKSEETGFCYGTQGAGGRRCGV